MMMNWSLSSSGVVTEVNERGIFFNKIMRDIVEQTYRCTFHLQYRNQYNHPKNQVISKLQEAFTEQWSMRPVRLAIEKKYNNKKESFKK